MKKKTLVVYYMYHKEGYVHPYIREMVKALSEHADVCMVCRESLSVEGREFLSEYCKEIYVTNGATNVYAGWKMFILDHEKEVCSKKYTQIICMDDYFMTSSGRAVGLLQLAAEEPQIEVGTFATDRMENDTVGQHLLVFQGKVAKDPAFFNYWNELRLKGFTEEFSAYTKEMFASKGFVTGEFETTIKAVDRSCFMSEPERWIANYDRTDLDSVFAYVGEIGKQFEKDVKTYIQETGDAELMSVLKGELFIVSEETLSAPKPQTVVLFADATEKTSTALAFLKDISKLQLVCAADAQTEAFIEQLEEKPENLSVIPVENLGLFSFIKEHIQTFAEKESLLLIDLTDCYGNDDVRYYLRQVIANDTYLANVQDLFEFREELGALIPYTGLQSGQFMNLLSGYNYYNRETREWRDRMGLVERNNSVIHGLHDHILWIRPSILCEMAKTRLEDIEAASEKLVKAQWQMLSSVVLQSGSQVGIIKNETEVARDYWITQQVLNSFLAKTMEKISYNPEEPVDAMTYIANVKAGKVVRVKEVVPQVFTVPIGFKESFRFALAKLKNKVLSKIFRR